MQSKLPYLDNGRIDWTAKRGETFPENGSDRRCVRFVVLWAYALPELRGVIDPSIVREWNDFLVKAAREVLDEWSDCVERIVHRHTIMPFMSINLGTMRLGWVQDLEMSPEYWKDVSED